MDDHGMRPPIPILRMYDVDATKRFYVDYLGFRLDWQEGDGDRPVYMRVSRGPVALDLSSHAGDGTPGTAIVVQVDDVAALHSELHSKNYPFMNPGIDPRGIGREVVVIDPASNQVRFFEAGNAEADA
ncbi:MAG TPA: glyoxalase superfamily protein [Gaiellaceae bacterium]|jgi:catechol 2,3-dioxygenase-like lactoylglutathione lyase family enzyme|nr:glyoxalase superfamily protein [Gaiellaceae bacterium]